MRVSLRFVFLAMAIVGALLVGARWAYQRMPSAISWHSTQVILDAEGQAPRFFVSFTGRDDNRPRTPPTHCVITSAHSYGYYPTWLKWEDNQVWINDQFIPRQWGRVVLIVEDEAGNPTVKSMSEDEFMPYYAKLDQSPLEGCEELLQALEKN